MRQVCTLTRRYKGALEFINKIKKALNIIKYVCNIHIYRAVSRTREGEVWEGRPRAGSQISKMTRYWYRRILSRARVWVPAYFIEYTSQVLALYSKVDGYFKNDTCVCLENTSNAVYRYSTSYGSVFHDNFFFFCAPRDIHI